MQTYDASIKGRYDVGVDAFDCGWKCWERSLCWNLGKWSSSGSMGKWPSSGGSRGTHAVTLTGMVVCAGLCALRSNLRGDSIMCRRSKPRFASYRSEHLDLRRVRLASSSGTKLVLYTLSSSSASSSLPKFIMSSP